MNHIVFTQTPFSFLSASEAPSVARVPGTRSMIVVATLPPFPTWQHAITNDRPTQLMRPSVANGLRARSLVTLFAPFVPADAVVMGN